MNLQQDRSGPVLDAVAAAALAKAGKLPGNAFIGTSEEAAAERARRAAECPAVTPWHQVSSRTDAPGG